MQMTRLKKRMSLMVCIVLIAAMALFTTGCNDNTQNKESDTPSVAEESQPQAAESQTTLNNSQPTILGQGATVFPFTVTDVSGTETSFEIHTDKTIVGEALQELNLLAGEEGAYGLYVKTVNGITLDFDKDGKYWAFYVDGEYASAGVDTTEIAEGSVYSFKAE